MAEDEFLSMIAAHARVDLWVQHALDSDHPSRYALLPRHARSSAQLKARAHESRIYILYMYTRYASFGAHQLT